MRLSENKQIVASLNQILEDYGYLKHDEERPKRDKNFDGLQIRVKPGIALSTERNIKVIEDIRRKLEKATNLNYFFIYGGSYSRGDNLDEVWTFFTLRALESPMEPELNLIGNQICREIERLIHERNLDITMDFEITVSHSLNFKFCNYSSSISSLVYIFTQTTRNLELVEKFSTVLYSETKDGVELQLLSSEEQKL